MMDLTDRHARYFMRLLTRHSVLYTEMITTGALLHGDAERHLRFDPAEHPVAAQLGGIDPSQLAKCAQMVEAAGYDEVNLNVGCPSDRVKSGRFGACLMAEPGAVADSLAAMREAVSIPVTIKTRIGIDRDESTDRLYALVEAVSARGIKTFIIHARNAWLDGLSPKENREIPPIRYGVVYALKRDFPRLEIVVNGGINSILEAKTHFDHVDGVMLGRAAYHNPRLLADVDAEIYEASSEPAVAVATAVRRYIRYVEMNIGNGVPLAAMTRHLLGLFHGEPGARHWRRALSEQAREPGAGVALVEQALRELESRRVISSTVSTA